MQNNPFKLPGEKTRLIDESDFASLYAAAEFALQFDMALDTHVCISWKFLGCETVQDIEEAFLSFTKRLRAWLSSRVIPIAYLYVHETGKKRGPHTHFLVYIRGGTTERREFRKWAAGYAKRRLGRRSPGAVWVTGPGDETPWIQWLCFSYLLKGYDRSVQVLSARRAPGGRAVRLGDLIAFPWKDPGEIVFPKRVGCSRSLGDQQRRIGVPAGFEEHLPRIVSNKFSVSGPDSHDPDPWLRPDQITRGPFRSKYDDGVRDVRELYPRELWEKILRPRSPLPMIDADEFDRCIAQLEQEESESYSRLTPF